jgi:hypothetical protein
MENVTRVNLCTWCNKPREELPEKQYRRYQLCMRMEEFAEGLTMCSECFWGYWFENIIFSMTPAQLESARAFESALYPQYP